MRTAKRQGQHSSECKHRERETRYLGMEAIVELCRQCDARRYVQLHPSITMTKADRAWRLPARRGT